MDKNGLSPLSQVLLVCVKVIVVSLQSLTLGKHHYMNDIFLINDSKCDNQSLSVYDTRISITHTHMLLAKVK